MGGGEAYNGNGKNPSVPTKRKKKRNIHAVINSSAGSDYIKGKDRGAGVGKDKYVW